MLEVPQKTFAAPPPLPVTSATSPVPVPVARPLRMEDQNNGAGMDFAPPPLPAAPLGAAHTDKVAVASSVCGLTPFIPVISQVIGLILGIWALFRIGRARRAGQNVRGRGWATAGIAGNSFVLLGWIALFGMFAALKGTLSDTTNKLHPLLRQRPAHHVRVRN